MIRALAVAAFALLPLQAFGQDTGGDCESIASSIGGLAGLGRIEIAQVPSDGWCEVTSAVVMGVDFRFEDASFRVDRVTDAPRGSRSLEVKLTALQTDFGVFDVEVSLSHDADTHVLELHSLRSRAPDGRGLQMTAMLSLDAEMDAKSIQAVLPHLALNDLSAKVFVTPDLLAALDLNFEDISRAAVDSALRNVSQTQVSSKSRRAFLGFVGAAPNAWGTLEIDLEAPSGVGVLQLVGPFLNLGNAPSDGAIMGAFDVALSGVMLGVNWKPGRM